MTETKHANPNKSSKSFEDNKPKDKTSKRTRVILLVLMSLVIVLLIISFIYKAYFTPSMNIAYSEEPVAMYAGPGTEYALEEYIQGYFEYDSIDLNGWMQVHRQNGDGETVLRWVDTSNLTSWGEYRYNGKEIGKDFYL